jgi:hypothetical protein
VFRRHLEESFRDLTVDHRHGLPIPKWVRLAFAAGALCLLGIGLFVFLPPRTPTMAAEIASAPESAPASLVPSDPFQQAPDIEIAPPVAMESGEIDAAVRESPTEQFRLEDVLTELRGSEAPSQSIVGDAPADELGQLIEENQETSSVIRDFLESILERLREQGGGLTEEEREQIRQEAGDVGNPQLMDSLMDLLGEDNPDAVEEMLESLLQEFDPSNPATQQDASEGSSSQAVPLQEDDPDWSSDASTGEGDPLDDATAAVRPESAEGDAEGENDAEPREGLTPGHEENLDAGGSNEAESDDSLNAEQDPVGFIREEAPTAIGEQGSFESFVTEGVPVELPSRLDAEREALTVDVERIQSMLRERGLPEDVHDAVRTYFELITEGGT